MMMNKEEERYISSKERGFLATLGKNRAPTIVPVCFVYSNGAIYTAIDEKPKSSRKLARVRNIARDMRVAFIVDNYSPNWGKLSYLLIHGKARMVEHQGKAEKVRNLLIEKYPQYRQRVKLKEQVIEISVQRTKLWKFRGG